MEFMQKRRKLNIIRNTLHKGIRKINVMKLKRSGSMVSAETAIHIPEVLSRQSSDTLKKSVERKPSHPHRMLTVTKKEVS